MSLNINANKSNNTIIAKLTSNRTGRMQNYIGVFLISVGKENFEKVALESAVKMINQEFKSCFIIVADTLQRHNIATENNLSDIDAHEMALSNGNIWINKYEEMFKNNLSIPYHIIRWDNLIKHDEFMKRSLLFSAYIKKNQKLKIAMQESIKEYSSRVKKRLGEENFKIIKNRHELNCFSYLQEECVIISLLPKILENYNEKSSPLVIVYPGKSTAILNENRDILIRKEYKKLFIKHNDFLNWIPYRFNKLKKDLTTQNANLNNYKLKNLDTIKYINDLLEKKLKFIETYLDKYTINEIKQELLESLLSNSYCTYKKLNFKEIDPTKNIIAFFIGEFIFILNSLDKVIANKCKANIIRIIKKEINQNKILI